MKTIEDVCHEAVTELRKKFTALSDDHLRQEADELFASSFEEETKQPTESKDLKLRMNDPVSDATYRKFMGLVRKRAGGTPLQHLTQRQQFLDHRYEVSADALVPRPETEVLVAALIDKIKPVAAQGAAMDVLEIGIGSGVIAIELLSKFNNLRVLATEASRPAMKLCERNADRILKAARPRLSLFMVNEGEVFPKDFERVLTTESMKFDWIVSNPPYLKDLNETTKEVHQHEPHIALYAPKGDPLFFYRQIAERGRSLLKPGGSIAVECPHERMGEILLLFKKYGYAFEVMKDLTGRQRHLFAKIG